MILGIDTSSAQCAVALVGEAVFHRSEPMQRGHAEALFPMIETLLAEAGASYQMIQRIGVCTGPGSFTGIRVGVAAARGLAMGCSISAIGVSRFEAINAATGHGTVSLPGRQNQIYVQNFNGTQATNPPHIDSGTAEDVFADPVWIARIAAERSPGPPPVPLYLREADADPPRETPPVILDA